jgi:hypothetical protein
MGDAPENHVPQSAVADGKGFLPYFGRLVVPQRVKAAFFGDTQSIREQNAEQQWNIFFHGTGFLVVNRLLII